MIVRNCKCKKTKNLSDLYIYIVVLVGNLSETILLCHILNIELAIYRYLMYCKHTGVCVCRNFQLCHLTNCVSQGIRHCYAWEPILYIMTHTSANLVAIIANLFGLTKWRIPMSACALKTLNVCTLKCKEQIWDNQ